MRFASALASLTILGLNHISHAAVILPRTSVEVAAAATVCACISGTITIGSTNCGSIGQSEELCTCVSVLADVVATTNLLPLKAALTLGGKAQLITSLTSKINSCGSDDKKTCTHPANSTPACSRKDLCGFTCNSGYKVSGSSCVAETTTVAVSAGATVCGCISGAIAVNGKQCGSLSASEELCTCISVLPDVVAATTLGPLKTALTLASKADLITSLTTKINNCGANDKKTCTHPSNSSPSCSRTDFCGFTCNSGYKVSGSSCVKETTTVAVAAGATVAAAATVCGCISGSIEVNGNMCGSLSTSAELCTCVSILADVVATTTLAPLKTALTLASKADLITSLTTKINNCGANDKKTCTHPSNSTPSCSRKDLCGFTCTSGYKVSGSTCVKSGLLGLGLSVGLGITL
ncbi:hypothetical protein DFH09DRAFT_1100576 [Mycena vulgaris]|nr:hypothetical protein DFH09DRAFT_1100576 [Mycena vulgaris]